MSFHPETLQTLSQVCRDLGGPCLDTDRDIAVATGWTFTGSLWMKGNNCLSEVLGVWASVSTNPPPFTHMLDGCELLIHELPYSSYGVVHRPGDVYKAHITCHYSDRHPKDSIYTGTHQISEVLSLCEAALFALSHL